MPTRGSGTRRDGTVTDEGEEARAGPDTKWVVHREGPRPVVVDRATVTRPSTPKTRQVLSAPVFLTHAAVGVSRDQTPSTLNDPHPRVRPDKYGIPGSHTGVRSP